MALRVSHSKSSVKIIHYCWFGPKIPLETADRIRHWQKLHPSWELRRSDEKNIDLQGCPYAEARLRDKEWSYLSDYVRLQALSLEGGVYLDADVEVLKPLDSFLDDLLHVGYMHKVRWERR
jgi:mannosyltransferase OCH1-like enzyme